MSKIFVKILIILFPFISFSQEVKTEHLPTTINTVGAELNFIQINEDMAYYTSSTYEKEGYQSLIFRTELKNGEWNKGKYFHLGKSYSYANISYPENEHYFYFSVIDKFGNSKIAFRNFTLEEMNSPTEFFLVWKTYCLRKQFIENLETVTGYCFW